MASTRRTPRPGGVPSPEPAPPAPAGRGRGRGLGLSRGDWRLVGACAVLAVAAGVLRYVPVQDVAAFVASALALALLAALVGRSVDALGSRLGAGATGAIQSALGNLPELFFGIFALRAGLVGVVQAALIGSILANVLLVLGTAFVAGGARHGTQAFGAEQGKSLSLFLLLAVAVIIVPSLAAGLNLPVAHHERRLSDIAAVVLLVVYGLSLLGSFSKGRGAGQAPDPSPPPGPAPPVPRPSLDGDRWPLAVALVLLAASSAVAALVSDWFVHALQPAIATLHISPAFAGLVIVAIAGNAVENVVGVRLAARDQSELAVSVILQSPLQIALVLIPVLVLASHVIGGAALTLVFPPLLVVSVALAAVVTTFVVIDGESTWMEGVALLGLYVVIAAAFWWG